MASRRTCPRCGHRFPLPGPVERATRARLRKLRGIDSAVKASAVALAAAMDAEPSAALGRELRLTVQALVAEAWEAQVAAGPPPGPAVGSVDDEGGADAALAGVIGAIGASGRVS